MRGVSPLSVAVPKAQRVPLVVYLVSDTPAGRAEKSHFPVTL